MELIEIPDQAISVYPGEIEEFEESETNNTFPYKIINVVALGILNLKPQNGEKRIDFNEVEKRIEVKRLNRFPCVMFKIDNISIILFRNGKLIITGIKDQKIIPSIKEKIKKRLAVAKIKFTEFEIKIQNLVVMSQLKKLINLEMACLTLTNCLYEPEQFPAAIVKPPTGGTFLIFSNSKIIGLGMKNIEMVKNSLRSLIQNIFDYDLFIDIHAFSDDLDDFDDDELFL
ncbi:MAG: hypothetical protein ACTSWX_01135 [Promethearchaeota archaeon]